MLAAIPAYHEHHEAFVAFDHSLRKFRVEQVEEWEEELLSWEADRSKPCPYESAKLGEFVLILYLYAMSN